MIHISGKLTFARDRDTRLNVGLLKIGGDSTEDGFNRTLHEHQGAQPALEVGTPDDPIPATHTAQIRLVYFEGSDKESLPSIVCCDGRMDQIEAVGAYMLRVCVGAITALVIFIVAKAGVPVIALL